MFDLIFGGITGLIGTIWSSYSQHKQKELELTVEESKQKHVIAMIQAESEAMLAEAQANIQISESKGKEAVELAKIQALSEGQHCSNQQSLSTAFTEKLANIEGGTRFVTLPLLAFLYFFLGLADIIKGLARSFITIYLLGISTWISYKAWELLEVIDVALSPKQAFDILEQAISVILYLSTTAVTWWFGDRMAEKNVKKNHK